MSYSFYFDRPMPQSYREIADRLAYGDLRLVEDVPTDGPWPEGVVHLYRHGRSTRGVEIDRQGDRFQIRLMILSAPEDLELAHRLIGELVGQPDTPISPEDGAPFVFTQLREAMAVESLTGQTIGGIASIVRETTRRKAVSVIPGPVRDARFGPRSMGELLKDGSPEALPERMLELIRRVQYVDEERYFPASAMQLRGPGRSRSFTLSVWAGGEGFGYLFPGVDYLTLARGRDAPDDDLHVPYSALADLAGDRWAWLDEEHTLVEPFNGAEWADLLRRAETYDVRPFPPSPRRWWWPF